jgi:hypothetical protein
MYARPLFVVVGIFGPVLVFFDALLRHCALVSLWLAFAFPLASPDAIGYTLAA